jgi:hypothetical protein
MKDHGGSHIFESILYSTRELNISTHWGVKTVVAAHKILAMS